MLRFALIIAVVLGLVAGGSIAVGSHKDKPTGIHTYGSGDPPANCPPTCPK